MQTEKDVHSLATYVSDMLALERHIRVPFDTQEKDSDFANYPEARHLVTRLSVLSDTHIDQLTKCLDDLGGHEASPIKSAVVEFEGAVAGAIDKMRKTKLSKALRDDYTALALCCAGYSALLATANAMRDQRVAAVAESLLQDYTSTIVEIGTVLPAVVVYELRSIGLTIDSSIVETTKDQLAHAWRNGSAAQERFSLQGTIEPRTSTARH